MKIFNAVFGRFICAFYGHDKVVDTVLRYKDGDQYHQVVYWRCTSYVVLIITEIDKHEILTRIKHEAIYYLSHTRG